MYQPSRKNIGTSGMIFLEYFNGPGKNSSIFQAYMLGIYTETRPAKPKIEDKFIAYIWANLRMNIGKSLHDSRK